MKFKPGDKVKIVDKDDFLIKNDRKKIIGLEATIIRYTPYRPVTSYYVLLNYNNPKLINECCFIEEKFLIKLIELDGKRITTMSEQEQIKCEKYKQKGICNKYCEMLQEGKCNNRQ